MLVRNEDTITVQKSGGVELGKNALVRGTNPTPSSSDRKWPDYTTLWVENRMGYFHPVAVDWDSGVKLEELVEVYGEVTVIWDGETR